MFKNKKLIIKRKVKGKGLYDKTINFFLGSRGNKLHNNERHAILYDATDKKYKPSFFMGPGTDIFTRIRNGDDKKIFSKSDKSSMAHDLRYYLSNSHNDIRNADIKMVNSLKNFEKDKTDSKWNTRLGRWGIQGKMILEDKLPMFFKPESFTTFGDYKKDNIENQNLARQKISELEKEGYGKRKRKTKRKTIKKTAKKQKR